MFFFVGYCEVREYIKLTNADYDRISVSHKTKPFGIYNSSLDKNEANKHYFLSLDNMCSGYDCFFTLKPETWEKDLKEALECQIKVMKEYYNNEIKILKNKGNSFIKDKNKIKINNYIKQLNLGIGQMVKIKYKNGKIKRVKITNLDFPYNLTK